MEQKYKDNKLESKYWKEDNEKKAVRFVSFVKKMMENDSFLEEVRSPLERVSYLLEHLKKPALINTLSFYVEEHMMDEKGLILELSRILCKYPYGIGTEQLVESYNQLSIVENVQFIHNGFEIQTKSGKITVYRALEALERKREYVKAYQMVRREDVELRMTIFNTKFSEDTIVSCFMPRIFGGISYEYYIELLKEQGYLDFRNGCFYPKEEFEGYFEPKILSKRKGKYLKTDILPLFVKK